MQEIVKKRSPLPIIILAAGVLCAVGLLLYFTVFSKEAVSQRAIDRQLTLAQHFLEELDYEQAVICYQAVLELDPKNEDVLEELKDVYIEWAETVAESDPVEAEKIYAEAEEYFAEFAEDTEEDTLTDTLEELTADITRSRDNVLAEYMSNADHGEKMSTLDREEAGEAGNGSEGGESGGTDGSNGSSLFTASNDKDERQGDSDEEMTADEEGDGESEESGEQELSEEEALLMAEEEARLQAEEEARQQAELEAQQSGNYDSAAVGSYITFGHYEQDNNTGNGAEPIEWQVLAHSNGRTLVISRYGLDCKQYHAEYTDMTWETCSLRSWLNGSFYNTAFTPAEQAQIISVTNANPDSYAFYGSAYLINHYGESWADWAETNGAGAPGGNATQDKVFCLSWEEALDYFGSDDARICTPTAYAVAQGAYKGYQGGDVTCDWWLRSPGWSSSDVVCVYNYGDLGPGVNVSDDNTAVRPALWLD